MGCACGCEPSEEELLISLERTRRRLEEDWQQLSEDGQKQGEIKHQKALARHAGKVQQVEARLARRIALSPEAD